VYLGTAVYPARHWPDAVRTFIRGPGRRKTLYATGFPTTGHRHTLGQLDEMELSADDRSAYLGGTARRIFDRLAPTDRSENGRRTGQVTS
jgi:predicted TIM-barrel fold metal-dependent hydrolase